MSTEQATTEELRLVTPSPQIHGRESTPRIMMAVILALVPAAIWSVYVYGLPALWTMFLSIAGAMGTEAVLMRMAGKNTLGDYSALLTGLLIGFNLPPSIPFYVPLVASVVAIAVVKWTFGGLGANWMNPALAGRVFVFFSWTSAMTKWDLPRGMSDAVSGASPLGFLKANLLDYQGAAKGPIEYLTSLGYPATQFGHRAADWLQGLGVTIDPHYVDFVVGFKPGSLGEVSTILLLLGAAYLFARKIITWQTPVAYLATFSLFAWVFGGRAYGAGLFTGNVFFHLLTGGIILGALFMATDMVTSPVTGRGQLAFGVGVGFLTFVIRFYGSFPEGVSLAIIFMNIFVPMIDRLTKPKRFGLGKGGEK